MANNVAADITSDAVLDVRKPVFMDARHLANDVKSSPAFALPPGANSFKLACDRSQFQNTPDRVISCMAYISYGGGKTEQVLVGFTATGGDLSKDGILATESSVVINLQQPKNPNRMIRVELTPLQDITTNVSALVK